MIHSSDVGPGKVMGGRDWEISAAGVEHVQPDLDSLAYRIDSGEGSIVFAGDTRPCPNLTELASGADLLVLECVRLHEDHAGSHTEDSETDTYGAGQTATDASIKKPPLCHQSIVLDDPVSKVQAIGEVRTKYAGPAVWGEELMELRWG